MRVGVVGAGALGLYYGALLQKAGEDVVFLMRRDYDAVVNGGLQIRSVNGDFKLEKVSAERSSEGIGSVDLVLVGLKAFDNDLYRALITPLIGEDTIILTLQNGLGNEELLAELFGPDRILGGVAFLCANRGEPGILHHLGAGRIEIGPYAGLKPEKVAAVAAMFSRAGVDCRVVRHLLVARWQKLVWNIPFNGLCSLLDEPVGRLLANPHTRALVRDIMLEVIDAANAQGLPTSIEREFAERMIKFSDGMGPYRPSMQIDRHEGRPLELDAIFVRPIVAGEASGVQLPKTRMLHALLSFVTSPDINRCTA